MLFETQGAMETVIHHIFWCGHVDSEVIVGDWETTQHIFVEGSCSRPACQHTDSRWLAEQHTTPDKVTVQWAGSLSKKLQRLTTLIDSQAQFAQHMNIPEAEVLFIGYPDLVGVLTAQDLRDSFSHYANIGETRSMQRRLRIFARKASNRPFYNFCLNELKTLLDDATDAQCTLHKAIGDLISLRGNPYLSRWKEARSCPSADACKDRSLGTEIERLRLSGERGAELLSKPLTASAIHLSTILLGNLGTEPVMPSIEARRQETIEIQTAERVDEWPQHQEKEFKQELAKKQRQKSSSRPALKRLRKPAMIRIPTPGM